MRLSAEARDFGVATPKTIDRIGTVVFTPRKRQETVAVRWDGFTSYMYFHQSFVVRVE